MLRRISRLPAIIAKRQILASMAPVIVCTNHQLLNSNLTTRHTFSTMMHDDLMENNIDKNNNTGIPSINTLDSIDLNLADYYTSYFQTNRKNADNILALRSGSIVELNPEIIEKYHPDGLAGEAATDQEFLNGNSWMIRDSTKFMCKLLLRFEALKNGKTANASDNKQVFSTIELPGLTNRSEWSSAKLSIRQFGKEKFQTYANTANTSSANVAVDSPIEQNDEALDNCLRELSTTDLETFPKKIMLTGTNIVTTTDICMKCDNTLALCHIHFCRINNNSIYLNYHHSNCNEITRSTRHRKVSVLEPSCPICSQT